MTLALAAALLAQCSPEHAAMGHCQMAPAKAAAPRVKTARPKPKARAVLRPTRHTAPAPAPAPRPAGAACAPEHAAMGHCTPSAATPAPVDLPTPASACPPEHAAMGYCTLPAPSSPAISTAPPPSPVAATYADRIWGAAAMAESRRTLHREHGGGRFSQVMINRAEIAPADGAYRWDADAWFGGDVDRLVAKTEGEGRTRGRLDDVELVALYSRAIGPYFNLQGGVRQDLGSGPSRTHLAIGVEGLAPYWFDVEAHAYLSTRGEVRAEISAYYDQRLTQRLILQPRVEIDLSAQDISALGISSGVSGGEVGLRLRYEIAREFAPYVGLVHERRWGDAATSSTGLVLGVRAWF